MGMFFLGMDFVAICITFVILLGVLLGRKNTLNEYFPMLLLLNALCIFSDMGNVFFEGQTKYLTLYQASVIAECSLLFCEIASFNLYVDSLIGFKSGKKNIVMRIIPTAISAIVIIFWMSSMVTKWVYTISDNATIQYHTAFLAVQIAGLFLALFPVLRVIVNQMSDNLDNKSALGIYIFMTIPLLSLVLAEFSHGSAVLLSTTTISYLVLYISIHVRAEQELLEKESIEEKRQTSLVMSQIQPHFIFNSLTAIRYLCNSDPALAMEALTKFTTYLRTNLDTIGSDNLIEFKKELEHTKTYLWLEELRFGSNLRVQYSIDTEDFMIPPLSLQPIVENAVKHGITKRIGGGTITIAVRETDRYYKITVSDDGVGFEHIERKNTKEAHIGINDVRGRIAQIKGSTLTVSSKVGLGTSVEYIIMKQEE